MNTPLRFHASVITPDGYGLLVGRSPDGKMLLCSRHVLLEKPRKIKDSGEMMVYRVAFGFYRAEDVRPADGAEKAD